jgi:predicted nucleotidyltransferase
MGYVDDAFANLSQTLEISGTEQTLAAKRQEQIREYVSEAWTLEDHFLTGSYRRETKTKPLSDVDIFVVIDRNGPQAGLRRKGPSVVLEELRRALAKHFDRPFVDRMACTVNFGEGDEIVSFEVVPAFKRTAKGGGYEIPDSRTNSWIATNPKTHHEMSTEKNEACGGHFVPFVKMVKGINVELGKPVDRSFLLEVMAHGLVKEPFGRYQDEVRWFLATAVDGVNQGWPDPAGLGPDVNTMSSSERSHAGQALEGALAIAEDAVRLEDDGQERTSVEAWRKLFGWRMPRP